MNETRKNLKLEPGKKYRGYGYLNDFGEFEFRPEQTGVNIGRKRLVKEGEVYTFYVTDNKVILHLSIDRVKDKVALLKKFTEAVTELFSLLRTYDI